MLLRTKIAIGVFIGILGYFCPWVLFIFTLITAVVYFISRIRDKKEKQFLTALFIAGFLLRVFLIIPTHLLASMRIIGPETNFAENGGGLFGDDVYLHQCAKQVASFLKGQSDSLQGKFSRDYGWHFFTYLMGILYYYFGNAPLMGKLLNSIISGLTGVIVYYIVKDGFGSIRAARFSAVGVTFWPTIILWSIVNLKDTFFIFFLMLAFLLVIKNREKIISLKVLIPLIILLFFIESIRRNFGIAMFCAFLIYAIAVCFYKNLKKSIIVALSSILIISALNSAGKINFSRVINFVFWDRVYELANRQRGAVSSGGVTYKIYPQDIYINRNARSLNFTQFLIAYTKGMTNFSLQPFPWKFESRSNFILFPQMVLWCMLILITPLGIFYCFYNRNINIILIVSFIFIFLSIGALSEGNIGTAVRHRDAITPLIIILASIGIVNIRNKGSHPG